MERLFVEESNIIQGDAIQWTGHNEAAVKEFVKKFHRGCAIPHVDDNNCFLVPTMEDYATYHGANVGDWIVKCDDEDSDLGFRILNKNFYYEIEGAVALIDKELDGGFEF